MGADNNFDKSEGKRAILRRKSRIILPNKSLKK
jgi:hypothetical protein